MRRKLATLPTGTVGYGSEITISCDAFLINVIMEIPFVTGYVTLTSVRTYEAPLIFIDAP